MCVATRRSLANFCVFRSKTAERPSCASQLLLRHGADKELKNNHGGKPVAIVCYRGNNQHKAAITALLR